MFKWLWGHKDELGAILGIFNKVHDKLHSFIENTENNIREKEAEVAKHYTDLDLAKSARDNIKKLLGV